jgi:hypothetical protein
MSSALAHIAEANIAVAMARGTSLAARKPLELYLQGREFVIAILSF